jgi:cellulose synthase/poly-beta-1,6-N-acetylglucosamine synthase-like glycosyltransferase
MVRSEMQNLFLISLGVVIYTFLVYPILIVILSALIRRPIRKEVRDDVSVSLIVAAYNEEKIIEDKLNNSLDLDYPSGRLEIMVVSDGSTDGTDSIVRRFADQGVQLLRVEGRRGKTAAQNRAVEVAGGDILVFSDANGMYMKDAIQRLVENFADLSVGGVSGRLVYAKTTSGEEGEEKTYWDIENVLKERESSVGSVLGANGSIYAIRRDLYVPLSSDMISDLVEPLKILERGHRVVYEKLAISMEDVASVSGGLVQAFQRKVRIQTRTIIGLLSCYRLLWFPEYGLVSWQFLSHKILRYLMPFLLLILFMSNLLALRSSLFVVFCFTMQCSFYLFSAIGYFLEKAHRKGSKVFSIPWYFVWTHAAAIVSFYRFLRGQRVVVWETVR